ncbi:MAG: maleylpyruvate isomerase family mycothiol-dependent enzyme [Nocardioidaceae bacterium]
MTTTTPVSSQPRKPVLDRDTAMRLAATEYVRCGDLLRRIPLAKWTTATDCPSWDVRALAAHMLGMAEMAASMVESVRQNLAAARRGGLFIDALTATQVAKHEALSPTELVDRFAVTGPRAARGRLRTPGLIRSRTMPGVQTVGDAEERWTFGYLMDVILTRDPWMHRVDLSRAVEIPLDLTPDHDGVLVADVVQEWAGRHGQPYRLHLTGPAGGSWLAGTDGPEMELDAIEFCRILSGRASGAALLETQVPF